MADITYTVTENSPENIPGFEQYSQNDKGLINSFEVNNVFNPAKNYIELHIFSLSDELLESDSQYTNFTQLGNAQSTSGGASVLTVDPVYDSRIYGYDLGGVRLLYHFLNDLFTINNTTSEFFIESISSDRTEVRLLPVSLADSDIVKFTAQLKSKLETQSYFEGFRLNFNDNDLFIAVNVDTVNLNQGKAVVVKLYEPLPTIYSEKSRLNIVETVSDSVSYEVDSEITLDENIQPTLRPANFNLEISDESVVPTGYLDYNELFSYPVNNANSEIYSLFNEKGINVSIDFNNYGDFVHFSSAEERLNNFKYKLDLITHYSASLAKINIGGAGSRVYFENLLSGIVSNFDHYERFLYYESGSSSWPKSNTTRPYENIPSIIPNTFTPNPTVSSWYSSQLTEAIAFDRTNGNSLDNAIPSYLKDDESNIPYLTFIYMIGQHFDNLWTYAKAVTDKYDGDNRPNFGISKDLVGEALKNFGVKLYTSNKSIEDLFGNLIGQSYQSGSEYITDYIVATPTGYNTPIEPTGFDTYQKEVQKRIYHNLPLLLKSKGTERGLKALINCFGIPSDILQIKYYGGRNINERPFFGDYTHYTSSLDKVRLDNTGSKVPGNILSSYTSITKRDYKYTDDLHNIEVGFAPSDNVDRYIISHSATTFSIDNYIGDPRNLTSPNYQGLYAVAEGILGNLERYDLQDYVRLIKFFDNVIFKMVKDFIPARVVADTGIIIKPNLLNRSKAKSVTVGVTRPEHSGSINTAFIESGDGGIFDSRLNDQSGSVENTTGYNRKVVTSQGITWKQDHRQEEAKYDGELGNSEIVVTNGELGKNNRYLNPVYPNTYYNVGIYYEPPTGLCTLGTRVTGFANPSTVINLADYFLYTNANTEYKVSNTQDFSNSTAIITPDAYSFSGVTGQIYYVQAEDIGASASCKKLVTITLQTCTVGLVSNAAELVTQGQVLNLPSYITNPAQETGIQYYINDILQQGTRYTVPTNAIAIGLTVITLKVKSQLGSCIQTKILHVNTITSALELIEKYVTTAEFKLTITNNSSNTVIQEKGICWSTSPNPTVSDSKLATTAPISAPITMYPYPLIGSTLYYFRTYVTTVLGTSYSSEVSTTTKELGITTLNRTVTDATYINFSVTATNPAQLPIYPGPTTTLTPPELTLEFSTIARPNITAGSGIDVTGGSGTSILVGTKQVEIKTRQTNAPYVFKAKAKYIQGNSGHDLDIYSTPVEYTVPRFPIGTQMFGGPVFAVKEYGSTGYAGVTEILILFPTVITNVGFFIGNNPIKYTDATSAIVHQNTSGWGDWNTTGYNDWRLPTRTEALQLQNAQKTPNQIGAAGLSLQNNYYHWTSTSPTGELFKNYIVRYRATPTFSDEDTGNSATWNSEQYYFRPIRTYANNSI